MPLSLCPSGCVCIEVDRDSGSRAHCRQLNAKHGPFEVKAYLVGSRQRLHNQC